MKTWVAKDKFGLRVSNWSRKYDELSHFEKTLKML